MVDDPDDRSRYAVWQRRVLFILPFLFAAMTLEALAEGNRTQATMFGLVGLANAGVLIQSRQPDGSHGWLLTVCLVLVFAIPVVFLTVLGISALKDGAVADGVFRLAAAGGWLALGLFLRHLRYRYRKA